MRNYTNTTEPGFSKQPKSVRGQTKSWIVPFLVKASIMFGLIFGAVTLRVYFNEKTHKLNKQAVEIRSTLHRLDLEMNNLRNRRETLSSFAYINSRITRFQLKLRPAEATQIHAIYKIGLRAPKTAADATWENHQMSMAAEAAHNAEKNSGASDGVKADRTKRAGSNNSGSVASSDRRRIRSVSMR